MTPFPPLVKQIRPSRGVFCFYPPVYPPSFFDTFSQADCVLSKQFCIRILAGRGTPFKTQRSRPPPYPHPSSSQMGPPASTCTVFRSNDLKIRGSLSKVRHPGSVRMVRVIIGLGGLSRGGRFWLRVLF